MDLCARSNDGRPCVDDDGEPCPQCRTAWQAEHDYWLAQYEVASPAERDPQAYVDDMIEAGRGHLLRHDELALVRR